MRANSNWSGLYPESFLQVGEFFRRSVELIAAQFDHPLLWFWRHINFKGDTWAEEDGMRLLHFFFGHDAQLFIEAEIKVAWFAAR